MRRRLATAGLSGLLGLALLTAGVGTPSPTAASAPLPTVVDVPVSFTVENVNRSGVPCATDGRTYTIRGHLTGPANLVGPGTTRGVTLYVHGLELGEWFWRLDVPGYNHAREMAELGHVSVTIDRLGYNNSSQPNGMNSCIGGQADIVHQIVTQLRRGTYTGSVRRSFPRVGVVGHSLGGSIAQIEAYSFRDVQALGVVSYADLGVSPAGLMETASWFPACLSGGTKSEAGAPGYAYFTRDAADFKNVFLARSTTAVRTAALPRRDLNPCGDLTSVANGALISSLRVREITAPVLVLSGTEDSVFTAEGVRRHRTLFTGSHDVTLRLIDGATHGITLDAQAATFRKALDTWLRERGL